MSDSSTYIAYISYRHIPLDMKAAKKIQKKIENYTIPEQFREQFGADKFGHVFRDEDELPSTASLSDSFRNAIDRSKYLIVVCTPDLPKSKWCEEEIKYFLETHDRNNLLAVLVDGEPETSFSPYMLHDFDENGNPIADYEPLAANINGPGRKLKKRLFNKEITRLFATFIGCPFASLWDREKLREKNCQEWTGNFTVVGNLNLVAAITIKLLGFGKYDGKYIITRASHSIGSGYQTSIEVRRCLNGY